MLGSAVVFIDYTPIAETGAVKMKPIDAARIKTATVFPSENKQLPHN
jgi:hypothetical protein